MEWRLELVQVPVSDVDRARAFYTAQVGFNAAHDHQVNDEIRFVQLTPPGSGCSIAIGTGLGDMQPGSVQGLQLVVSDIHAAREELAARGVEVGEVQEFPWGSFVLLQRPGRQRLGRPTDPRSRVAGRERWAAAPGARERQWECLPSTRSAAC